jgi:acetylornithine deacetylase
VSRDARSMRAGLSARWGSLKRLLQQLVRTKSVAIPPGGAETPAQRVLQTFLHGQGVRAQLYSTEFIERSGNPLVGKRSYRGRKNLSARLSGTGRGKRLLLNGHMDTMPPGKTPWSRSPWSGVYQDGRVHGRGSFDMKGGVVATAFLSVFARTTAQSSWPGSCANG